MDAVQQTLTQQPNIKIAEQEIASKGASLQEADGRFDLTINSSFTRTDDQSFGTETQNDASVNFNLIIPLQKGWGRDVVEAGVRSARVSVQSSRFSLQYTTILIDISKNRGDMVSQILKKNMR